MESKPIIPEKAEKAKEKFEKEKRRNLKNQARRMDQPEIKWIMPPS